ncbi:unnamed protein product [Urochloa humidicola]
MKSGVENCDSNGKSGPIPSEKAQRRVDDYFGTLEALHPDDFEQRKNDGNLDAEVVYKSSGNGLAHGRVPIANGAVRKCDIKASGRTSSTTRQTNSGSYQYLVRRNAQLEKIGLLFCKRMPDLFAKMNMPVPQEIADILQEANAGAPSSDQVSQSSCHAENGASGNGDGAGACGNDNGPSGNCDGASGTGNVVSSNGNV